MSESQAGFRRGYSTVDNIYNLISIIKISHCLNKKKIYACFVDFKSAFDTIPRDALFYKLLNRGVSSKIIHILRELYKDTKAQIWNGTSLSSSFDTNSGVKQGCILSPLLFALFIDDLVDYLGVGLTINNIEIKVLMYADDIVLLSDDPVKLQSMIDRLGEYCGLWGLRVNLDKSKIMIFHRGGGIRGRSEKWAFRNEAIEVVKRYVYLGVLLTPKLSFNEHLKLRLNSAKVSLNCTWKTFLRKKVIKHSEKVKLFNAVSRSILCYASQVWGYLQYEDVEKLQRFFLKKLLCLPQFTPNYALSVETGLQDLYIYTLQCHFSYIWRTLFLYSSERLPNKLTRIIIEKNIFWCEVWSDLAEKHEISSDLLQDDKGTVFKWLSKIMVAEDNWLKNKSLERARGTVRHELYHRLNYSSEENYFKNEYAMKKISLIMKYRCGLVTLNASPWRREGSSLCSLCNLNENENLYHFLGVCPILAEFRKKISGKKVFSESEAVEILNGKNNYNDLYNFVVKAWKYRSFLVNEYNN